MIMPEPTSWWTFTWICRYCADKQHKSEAEQLDCIVKTLNEKSIYPGFSWFLQTYKGIVRFSLVNSNLQLIYEATIAEVLNYLDSGKEFEEWLRSLKANQTPQ